MPLWLHIFIYVWIYAYMCIFTVMMRLYWRCVGCEHCAMMVVGELKLNPPSYDLVPPKALPCSSWLTIWPWLFVWTSGETVPYAHLIRYMMFSAHVIIKRSCSICLSDQSMIDQICRAQTMMTKITQMFSGHVITKSCCAMRFVLDCASRQAWMPGCIQNICFECEFRYWIFHTYIHTGVNPDKTEA